MIKLLLGRRLTLRLTGAGRAACAGRREDRGGLVDREVPVCEGEG